MNSVERPAGKFPNKMACRICGTITAKILTDRLRKGAGTIFYCKSCDHGSLILDEKIDAKEYYSKKYRQEYSHRASGSTTNAREIFDTYNQYQGHRVELISQHLFPTAKVLEVGASAGQFLSRIKSQVAQVDAIELDESCCEFMRNELNIRADSEFIRTSKFCDEKYDVVCAFQVMEHVESPVDFLLDLRLSMKKDAVAFVEVPNLHDPLLSVWNVNSYKTFYYHSAHLHYFSESSLKKAAISAGFLPGQISIKFTQDYNLLNHLNWITNDAPQATCDVGLSEINVRGANEEISNWLTENLKSLNSEYIAKLITIKATSNLMMVLSNGR